MTIFLFALLTLFGLAIGSFLNVVAYRVPRGESLARPPSHCPHCAAPIRPRHNVPVLGWLLLRGHCADCHEPISPRYPLVEAATGVLFLALGWWTYRTHQLPVLPALLYFTAVGIALALTDIDTRRLPNTILLPAYPILAALLTGAAWYQHDWPALGRAATGTAILLGFFALLWLIHRAGLGGGDVKLAGLLGAVLGYVSWRAFELGVFSGFLLAALAGIAAVLSHRASARTTLPFAPFLLAGTLLAILIP